MSILFLLLACQQKTEDSTETPLDENLFVPALGHWNIPVGEYNLTDTCVEDPTLEVYLDIQMLLSVNNDGSYIVSFDHTIEGDCTLDHNSFSCTGYAEDSLNESAVIRQSIHFVATMTLDTEMTGNIQTTLDCEGDGCSAISVWCPEMPCGMDGDFSASFVSEVP